ADAGVGRQADGAALDLALAEDGAEQRRLAGAVPADQADAGAVGKRGGGVLEQQPAGDAEGNVFESDHGARLVASARRRRNSGIRKILTRRGRVAARAAWFAKA